MKGVKVQPALPRGAGGKYLLHLLFPNSSQKGEGEDLRHSSAYVCAV